MTLVKEKSLTDAIQELRVLDDALFLAKKKREDFYKKVGRGNVRELEVEFDKINLSIESAQENLTEAVNRHFSVIRPALSKINIHLTH